MTIDKDDLLNSILDSLGRIQYIKSADIPNIDLYMDQVTTFMESKLKNTSRNPEADKLLTKTMINNYAKNDLLPPPVKKKRHSLSCAFVLICFSDVCVILYSICRIQVHIRRCHNSGNGLHG